MQLPQLQAPDSISDPQNEQMTIDQILEEIANHKGISKEQVLSVAVYREYITYQYEAGMR